MTLGADLAADYAYIDAIETVTFTDLDASPTADVKALRGTLNYRETTMAAAGAYDPSSITWELWSDTLSGAVPQAGCTITDSSNVVYTIVDAVEYTYGSTSIRWRCVCRKQR